MDGFVGVAASEAAKETAEPLHLGTGAAMPSAAHALSQPPDPDDIAPKATTLPMLQDGSNEAQQAGSIAAPADAGITSMDAQPVDVGKAVTVDERTRVPAQDSKPVAVAGRDEMPATGSNAPSQGKDAAAQELTAGRQDKEVAKPQTDATGLSNAAVNSDPKPVVKKRGRPVGWRLDTDSKAAKAAKAAKEGTPGNVQPAPIAAATAAGEVARIMPRRRPNPGTASKPVDRSASAQPSLDEQGNPVRRKPGPKPKVDEFGNRINPPRPKTDEEGKPLPKRKPGPKPKVDEQGNLVPKAKPGRKPKLDAEGNRVHPPREPRSKPSPQPDAAPAPRRKGGRPPKTPAGAAAEPQQRATSADAAAGIRAMAGGAGPAPSATAETNPSRSLQPGALGRSLPDPPPQQQEDDIKELARRTGSPRGRGRGSRGGRVARGRSGSRGRGRRPSADAAAPQAEAEEDGAETEAAVRGRGRGRGRSRGRSIVAAVRGRGRGRGGGRPRGRGRGRVSPLGVRSLPMKVGAAAASASPRGSARPGRFFPAATATRGAKDRLVTGGVRMSAPGLRSQARQGGEVERLLADTEGGAAGGAGEELPAKRPPGRTRLRSLDLQAAAATESRVPERESSQLERKVLGLGGGLPQPVRKERPATAGRQESLPEGSAARMVLGLGGGLPKKPLAQLPNGIAKMATPVAASGLPTPVDQSPPPATNAIEHTGLNFDGKAQQHQRVVFNNVAYISGCSAPDTTSALGSTYRKQIEQVLLRLEEQLSMVGSSKHNILMATVYLRNVEEGITTLNEIWQQWLHPDHLPARTVAGAQLYPVTALVEISLMAAILDS